MPTFPLPSRTRITTFLCRRSLRILSTLFIPLDGLLTRCTSRQVEQPFRPVFIIGAPRTGSTLLYQLMVSHFHVAFINNFLCLCFKSMCCAMIFWTRVLRKSWSQNIPLRSTFGSTESSHGPSECGQFWNRWFPRDRHYITDDDMTEKRKRSLRRTVYALQRFAGAPLVFKNMNQCLRLEALAQIFPDALFIWCRRNPLYTAQSLYRTREALFGDTTRWWSLRPPEYRDIVKQEPLEQVVSQIYHIERHTQEGLDSCYPDNYIVVWYEDTVENPAKQLNRLSTFFSTSGVEIHKRPCSNSHTLTSGNRQTIHDESFNRLRSHVSTLYGASD